jgi:hypothetical protein
MSKLDMWTSYGSGQHIFIFFYEQGVGGIGISLFFISLEGIIKMFEVSISPKAVNLSARLYMLQMGMETRRDGGTLPSALLLSRHFITKITPPLPPLYYPFSSLPTLILLISFLNF